MDELIGSLKLAKFAVLRTPLLPFDTIEDLRNGSLDINVIEARIKSIYANPAVREAVLVASKSLFARCEKWAQREAPGDCKTRQALAKYLFRMSHRCTPFGLCAGLTWGSLEKADDGNDVGVDIGPIADYRRNVRIDMAILADISKRCLSEAAIREKLTCFCNPTLHRRGSRWQYIEAKLSEGTRRFELCGVEGSIYLNDVLRLAGEADDLVSIADLAAQVKKSAEDVSHEDALEFVYLLIKDGLLLTNLEPPLTDGDPLAAILEAVAPSGHDSYFRLKELHAALSALNALPPGSGQEGLLAAEGMISSALGGIPVKNVIQTDMFKPTRCLRVPAHLDEDVRSGLVALMALAAPAKGQFRDFASSFSERFGRAEVPLLDALDPEIGIPFESESDELPLLRGLEFQKDELKKSEAMSDVVVGLLMRRVEGAWRENRDEVELSEAEIENLMRSKTSLVPPSLYVSVSILSKEKDAPRRTYIRNAGGASGAQLIGRFCVSESDLTQNVREYIAAEEKEADPEACFPEIVHWPVGRVGNVLLRHKLRRAELPIFGRPTASKKDRVSLNDILVSVRDGEIRLRDRKSGRRVFPRLTNAHNTERNSVSVYKFLAGLQYQSRPKLTFSWPFPLASAASLPRLVYKGCILAPRMWYLSEDEILKTKSNGDALTVVTNWAARMRWPRFVELVIGDNCLCVDTRNPLSAECFLQEITDQKQAVIQEVFEPEADAFARGTEGRYCHELIIPLLRTTRGPDKASAPQNMNNTPNQSSMVETLPPGGNWLYFKIYCGYGQADRILTDAVEPFIAGLRDEGLIRKWFFLRYRDSAFHIRVRVEGKARELSTIGLQRLNDLGTSLLRDGRAWSLAIDSYSPEITRYGGREAIGTVEKLFEIDSDFAVNLLNTGLLANADIRWKALVPVTDWIWRDAGFDLKERLAIYSKIVERNFPKTTGGKRNEILIGNRYRHVKGELEAMLWGGAAHNDQLDLLLRRRSEAMRPLLKSVQDLNSSLSETFISIVGSFAHMSVNRLCTTSNTAQECAVYALLKRAITTRLSRAEQGSKKTGVS